jgi:hypothetical protein
VLTLIVPGTAAPEVALSGEIMTVHTADGPVRFSCPGLA